MQVSADRGRNAYWYKVTHIVLNAFYLKLGSLERTAFFSKHFSCSFSRLSAVCCRTGQKIDLGRYHVAGRARLSKKGWFG